LVTLLKDVQSTLSSKSQAVCVIRSCR
jgi:hypothetical protein